MYVCSCNGLTDTQIQAAIAAGAHRTRDIYAACSCRAQCGGCTKSILCMLRDRHPDAEGDQDAAASIAN